MKVSVTSIKWFVCFLLIGISVQAQNQTISTQSNQDCMTCHKDHISVEGYNASVHQTLTCIACHVKEEGQAVHTPKPGEIACTYTFKAMDCASCHSDQVKEHALSIHNSERLAISCAKCHADIHTIKSIKKDKVAASKLCSSCHEKETGYFTSVHYKALSEGNNDAPGCIDCHGTHSIEQIDNKAQGRAFHTQACMKCHADEKMMEHSEVTTIAPETYFESYHGKSVRLGYPEKVAGCADCHGAHNILPKEDENSMVHAANLTNTCKQCHTNASDNFAKFIPHADPYDKEKNPSLFWVTMFMNALMIGTFIFFWVHSLLWAFRGFVEKKQLKNAEFFSKSKGKDVKHQVIKPKVYRRFKTVHIVLHIFVVSSFLGLAITGLPLKFNNTNWGKHLMDFLGGVSVAGIIHRISAIITFGYLFITVVMSIRFLFSKKESNEPFMRRLFGPDSLFPNMKDARDIRDMFKWFFFRGPKPRFDRWTYWEKFDFLAVFWGVAVIGSSGILLWKPELLGQYWPGWLFNIATIVHSDEALLAVGFIFTIHFFNTHMRAEKFPMDFVIFNGQVTEEEMVHERGEQWERYQQEGMPEDFEVHKPSSLFWDIALRLFGLFALLTGVILALLIIYTFIF